MDGSKLIVPCYNADALKLVIKDSNSNELGKDKVVSMNFSATAAFSYSNLAAKSTIVVIPPTGWTAILDRDKSTITIGSPSENDCKSNPQLAGPVETVVVVSSGNGLNAFYTIRTQAASTNFISCNASDLGSLLTQYPNVKNLKVSGALTADHMAKIKDLKSSLVEIDLEEATLDGGIPDSQFSDFSNLTTVKLPKDLKKIGGSAFYKCDKLTTVSNIEGVEEIGDWAFKGCKVLNSTMKLEGLTKIGTSAFIECAALTNITIGNKVKVLSTSVFSSCTSLKNFTVPASVKTIGEAAFYGCSGLATITIEGTTEIGTSAFRDCSSLTEITLPSTLEKIGKNVFYGCTKLESLTCKSEVPPTCSSYTQEGSLGENLPSGFKIYVPSGFVDDYKNESTIWSQYKDKIQAIK